MAMEMKQVLTEIRDNFQLFQSKKYPTVKEPLAYYNLASDCEVSATKASEYWKTVDCVLVHYPALVVTNSAKYTHIIQDLWVCIRIWSDYRLGDVTVIRSTVTSKEYEKNYTFSHAITGNPFNDFKSLCFGRGCVADYIMTLRQEDYNRLKWMELPQYLFDYFEWESLEGGPHIEMSRLFESGSIKWDDIGLTYSCFKGLSRCSARELVNALLKYDEQRLMQNVTFSYKEGTLYIAPLHLDRLNYNIFIIIKEYNEAEISPSYQDSRKFINYRGVDYIYVCGWNKYILTKDSLTVSSDTSVEYQDNILMFTLPDGREIRSKIIDKKSEVSSYEVYAPSPRLTIEVAGAYIRKKNPIKYNYM